MKWILFAWKNVMRNRRRSLTAMLITAMGTAAVLIGGGFALFTYESLEEMTARDTGHIVLAHAQGFEGDEDVPMQYGLAGADQLAAEFSALPQIRAVAPRIQFSGLISNGDKSSVFVGSGVVPDIDFRLRGPQMNFVSGEAPGSGGPAPEVVIGNELAKLMKAKVGTSLTPLHSCVVEASRRDAAFYEVISLVELLRSGQIQLPQMVVQQPELGHREPVAARQRCRVGRVIHEGRLHRWWL